LRLYLDTSLLVSALTKEPSTEASLDWIAAHRHHGFTTSRWAVTEFSSALAMKVRSRALEDRHRKVVLRAFGVLMTSFDLVAIQTADFDAAARLMDSGNVAVRSGDALHLATAIRLGLPLRTLDRRFVSGALATGHDIALASSQ